MKEFIKRKLKKNKHLLGISKKIFLIFQTIYLKFFMFIFSAFKIQNNKIVIVSYYGKGYGDNAKYIVEQILKKNNNALKIYWAVKSKKVDNNLPSEIKEVKYNSIKYLYHLSTAKIWINNTRFLYGIKKRKEQFYIQTWHAGVGLKKIEADAIKDLEKDYIKQAKEDSKMINYAISNSKYRTKQYKNSFWYEGEILEIGCPRNDLFFDLKSKKQIEEKIRKKYNISKDSKIILYAPTFRTNYEFDYFSINFDKLLKQIEKNTNHKYIILVKLHPNKSNLKFDIKNIVNVTNYADTDELLLITDILISDFSSIMFDFMFMDKPIYLYAPDKDLYLNKRGLNFDYDKLPFSISEESDVLIKNIINEDYKKYQKKLDYFKNEVGIIDDGTASEKLVKLIEEIIGGVNDEKI